MKRICLVFVFLFSFAIAAETKIAYVAPFQDGVVDPAYSIQKSVEGKCYSSINNPRGDAWRCTDTAGVVYDPCFSKKKDRNILACLTSPWDKKMVELKAPLPYIRVYRQESPEHYQPWGLELSNGIKCSLATGATTEINHESVSYLCEKDTAIIGGIHREKNRWVASWKHGYFTDWMNIATAWY